MKVIIKTVAGSHLFGLNTQKSDKDYKGVYIPSSREIILGNYSDTRQEKTNTTGLRNTSQDVDIELFSLRKFLKMCANGDTAALELLFCPDEFILEKTPEWDYLLQFRDKLISKQINAIIGYARQQIAKYGGKGTRVYELSEFNKILKEYSKQRGHDKLLQVYPELCEQIKHFQYIIPIKLLNTNKEGKELDGVDILGKKFDININIATLSKYVSDKFKHVGQRSREVMENGGYDFKSCSHSLRVTYQAEELLTTGKITLPHTGEIKRLLMDIKLGNYDFKNIDTLADNRLKLLEELRVTSNLQEKVSQEFIDDLLVDMYTKEIL